MKLTRAKTTVVLMVILGGCFLAGFVVFLARPTLAEVRRLNDLILQAQAKLEAQYTNRKNLLSNRAKVAEARETLKHLSIQFVRPGRELDFITAVEALAAKNGVSERLQLSKNESEKTAPELVENFDLSIDGPYRGVMQMLVDLEKMPTLLVTQSLLVRPGGMPAPGESPSIFVTMRGSVVAPPTGL